MIKWLSNLLFKNSESTEDVLKKKIKQAEQRAYEARYQGMVSEPVQSFVQYALKNRRFFSVKRGISNPIEIYNWQNTDLFFTVVDTKLDDKWTVYISSNTARRYSHDDHYLYDVYGLPFELNHWELTYLYDHLYPVLSRQDVRARQARIIQSARQREINKKLAAEKVIRREYEIKYKEAL